MYSLKEVACGLSIGTKIGGVDWRWRAISLR